MAIQPVKENYSGKIREVQLGSGPAAVTVGGAAAYPFHGFEGALGNRPRIAWEMWDTGAADAWPEAVKAPFADVIDDPVAWAKKLETHFQAELIALRLQSTDPNGQNGPAADAAETVQKCSPPSPSR